MPIGDLLASITGEQPSPSPTSATRSGAAVPKRKAVDELRPAPATKAPRTGSPSTASSRPNGSSPRPSPHPADKPAGSLNARPPTNSQRSTNLSSSISRQPSSTSVRNGDKPSPVGKPTSSGKPIPSRPLNSRPVNTDSGPKPEQKKGSFAEILARAKANAELRESFGKIQHKAIEKKPLTMKERKLQKAEEARQIKLASKKQSSSGYAGTGASARPEAARSGQRPTPSSALSKGKDKTPPAPEVKKVKKAALATTGYTGTARPRPGAAATKPGAASRPSREEERERPRYPSAFSRPRRRDEEDDLDDFIDYDEEEEEVGYGRRRFEFDSADDDSDMEAGLSDIDQEERRAERQARLEDLKEIEMEKRLREEKRRRLAGRA